MKRPDMSGWNEYVTSNYLQDFVCKNEDGYYGIPKELWKGHFDGIQMKEVIHCDTQKYRYIKERAEEFYINATERIRARGRRMVEALKKSEKYWDI